MKKVSFVNEFVDVRVANELPSSAGPLVMVALYKSTLTSNTFTNSMVFLGRTSAPRCSQRSLGPNDGTGRSSGYSKLSVV